MSQGYAGIGPSMRPYRSLSQVARESKKANTVFYSPKRNADEVACPFDPTHPVGNTVALTVVHSIIPLTDGRIPGAVMTGDKHVKYELACCAHLPPEQRIPLEVVNAYSKAPGGDPTITCFYCNHPKKIDKKFVPPPEVAANSEKEPILAP